MKRSVIAIAIATVLAGSAAMAQQSTTPTDGSSTDRSGTGTTRGDTSSTGATSTGTTRDDTGATSNRSATRSTSNSTASDRTTNMTRSSDTTNKSDETFLKDFSRANAAEVAAGKIATDKAQNAEVKAFAKHMVDDHSKTLDKVQALAGKNNVDVKDTPDMMHKAKTAMMEHKDGAAFDAAYLNSQVDDHQKVVEMLQDEIKDGKDAAVKQLASQALSDVQKHLKMAKTLQAKVDMDKNSSKSSMRKDAANTEKLATDR